MEVKTQTSRGYYIDLTFSPHKYIVENTVYVFPTEKQKELFISKGNLRLRRLNEISFNLKDWLGIKITINENELWDNLYKEFLEKHRQKTKKYYHEIQKV